MNSLPAATAGEELDLHELVVEQAITAFIRFYNNRISTGDYKPIDVIHGDSHGDRIKRRLRAFLAEHSQQLTFTPGEKLDGNSGRTRVYPERALPEANNLLEGQILEFCQSPKLRERIIGKFRRYSYPEVAKAIENLVKEGQLREVKDGQKRYTTARR